MKKLLLSITLLVFGVSAFAQDLPDNPEPGKCYVRCKTPDVWKNEDVTVQVSPAYKKISTRPAEFKTETERVLVKEASQRLVSVPAVYESRNIVVVTKEASQRLEKIAASTTTATETVVIKEASQRLELVPAVYETKDVVVEVQPATYKLEVVPAVYETRDVIVVTKEASQRLEVVPATYGKETITYHKKDYGSSLKVVPASFSSDSEVIEVKAASAQWQMSDVAPDCESSDPNDCRYWCYKEIPAQFETVNKTVLASDAKVVRTPDCVNNSDGKNCGDASYSRVTLLTPPSTRVITIPEVTKIEKKTVMVKPATTRRIEIPAVFKTLKKTVMVTPPTTRVITIPAETTTVKKTIFTPESTRVVDIPEVTKTVKKTVMVTPPTTRVVDIPAEYSTVSKTVLVKDAWEQEVAVPAQFKTVTKEVLVQKGGLTTWKEVDCKLTENSILPINWNLGSASLTAEAKRIIDTRLLPVLKTGVAIALESHTDARGTKESNQNLSERRAVAVSNYLISKGINASQLTANGFGERRLTNRCADGVSCTEKEHAQNRRTTFRVINQ
ncbi:OmpA family protein [Lutibacter flavus]|uniref:OmpA family protein n=1 Tax=Lutibacter flavus TaxID=691689 RepID=A0A238XU95_9FLAO|nr:OmpA family protein [Lutibacter flavus]SNR62081.1 OmpA family protein [Lutibacter flavus]